jgi:hypothetical protein
MLPSGFNLARRWKSLVAKENSASSAAVIGPAKKPSSASWFRCSSLSGGGGGVGGGDGKGVEGEGVEAVIA